MRLIVLDDDEATGRLVRRIALTAGFSVAATTTADEFVSEYHAGLPDVVVLDLQLGDTDGVEQVRGLASHHFSGSLILVSGFDKRVLATATELARTLGLTVAAAVCKPIDIPEFRRVLAEIQVLQEPMSAQRVWQAIQSNELVLEYQPIVTRGAKPACKLEALIRWRHPELGVVGPGNFVPVAESEPELINALTDWVICAAVRDHAWLRSTGVAVPIGVNVSPQNLHDLGFPDRVGRLLKQAAMPADQLCFEITETAAFHDATETMDILSHIRLKGIKLAIDDFGIGYSSLKLLRQMPFCAIKIDRSFVTDLSTSRDARAIIQCIVDLADDMELQSIAEGVETETDATMLEDMGVDCLQGFLIARPMPVDQVPIWLEQLGRQVTAVPLTGTDVSFAGGEASSGGIGAGGPVLIGDTCAELNRAGLQLPASSGVPRLSRRQREVIALLAEGCSVKVMARRLQLGVGTVKAHLAQAYLALGAHNRIEAVCRAGMIHLPEVQV